NATGSPFSKSIVVVCGVVEVAGVGHGDSGRHWFEVSVSAPPADVPQSPLWMEYLAYSALYGQPCLVRSSLSASREIFRSRIGVMISTPGIKVLKIISTRTWSFPAPVEPCATHSAPIFLASLAIAVAWQTRSAETDSG